MFSSCNEKLTSITANLSIPNAIGDVIPDVIDNVIMAKNTTKFLQVKITSSSSQFICSKDFISLESDDTNLIDSENITVGGNSPFCELGLTPKPNQAGQTEVTIKVNDGVQTSEASFEITVEVPAKLAIKTAPTFPSNIVRDSTQTFEYVITNNGEKEATAISLEAISPPFTLLTGDASDCGTTLAVGDECKVRVEFTSEGETTTPESETLKINYFDTYIQTSLTDTMTATGSPYAATLAPQHPTNGANLLDWIENSHANVYDASNDVACTVPGVESRSECLHGGTLLEMVLPNFSSCVGLSFSDSLDAFNWSCYVNGSTQAVAYSTGLKSTSGLRDLVNATSFKANYLNVEFGGKVVYRSDNAGGAWWTNTVKAGPANATGNPVFTNTSGVNSGDILTYMNNVNTNGIFVRTSKVAFIGLGSSKIKMTFDDQDAATTRQCHVGDGSQDTGVDGRATFFCINSSSSFLWIENFELDGENASGGQNAQIALGIYGGHFSTIKDLDIYNIEDDVILYQTVANNDTTLYSYENISINANTNTSYGSTNGIDFNTSRIRGTIAKNIEINNVSATGIDLSAASTCIFSDFESITINNVATGIDFDCGAEKMAFKNVEISTTSSDAITCAAATPKDKYFTNFKASNIDAYAVNCAGLTESRFLNSQISNVANGLYIGSDNTIVGSTLSGATGTLIESGVRTIAIANTLTNADTALDFTSSTLFHNNLVVNNATGYISASSNNLRISNSIITNNTVGINFNNASNNKVFGSIVMGNTGNCVVVGGTDQSLTNSTCSAMGAEDEAVTANFSSARFYFGKTADATFTGPVNDATNSTPLLSSQPQQSFANINDWLNFDNEFRTIIKYDTGFSATYPDQTENRGLCTTGNTCATFDFSLRTNDVLVKESANFYTTGGTFTPVDDFPPNSTDNCPSDIDGNEFYEDDLNLDYYDGINAIEATGDTDGVCEVGEQCRNRFLKNAIEVLADSIGDDDGLCEENETCIYTPNIGSYQGHGDTTRTCVFQDNTITGVTILRYENNGR